MLLICNTQTLALVATSLSTTTSNQRAGNVKNATQTDIYKPNHPQGLCIMTTTTIEKQKHIEWLEKEYPRGAELVYIDYRDSIEDAKQREELLQNPNESYSIILEDWYTDAQYERIDYILDEYKAQNDICELDEDMVEEMRDWLFENDTSTPIDDLLKNTGDEYLYYETGIGVGESWMLDEKQIMKKAKKIALILNIDFEKNSNALYELLGNGGNGEVVILFEGNVRDFLDDAKYIVFDRDYELCIMNRWSGSGHSVKIENNIYLDFKRERLHSDSGVSGYSFAGGVCGLCRGIMVDGHMTSKRPKAKKVPLLDEVFIA